MSDRRLAPAETCTPWTERRERCCGVSRVAGQCSRLPRSYTAPCSGVPATPGTPVARLDSTRVSPTTSSTPSVFHERMIRAVHEVHDICWRLEGHRLHAPARRTASAGWRCGSAMRSNNACKTCALGMGGQMGGMVNEAGHFPEVCKKSLQAMAADMQTGISPEFFARYSIAQLRSLSPRELESCGRLVDPLYAGPGDTHYRVITWDEAIGRVAGRLKATDPGRSFFYASGRSSNEAGFLLQLLARAFGTNYVNNCSYYCHQASGVGLAASLGTGTATVQLEDVEGSDLFVLIGGNPASNHPRLLRSLMAVRRRGGHVIVINPAEGARPRQLPRAERCAEPAVRQRDRQPVRAAAHRRRHRAADRRRKACARTRTVTTARSSNTHTEGFAAFERQVAVHCLGRDRVRRGRAARDDCAHGRDVHVGEQRRLRLDDGHHAPSARRRERADDREPRPAARHGRAAACRLVADSRSQQRAGNGIGRRDAGAQESDSCAARGASGASQVPTSPGLDTMACIEACGRGDMDTAVCLGGNLFGSNPDAKFAQRGAWQAGPDRVSVDDRSTPATRGEPARETLVLPVLPRDEEPQPTTQESMFSYVRLSDGGPARHHGPRSEVSVLSALAHSALGDSGPVDWNGLESHQRIRALIADVIPGLEPMADIDRTRARVLYCRTSPGHGPIPDRSPVEPGFAPSICRHWRRPKDGSYG